MKKESEMETGREREKESLQQQTHNGTYLMLQQLGSKSTARKMFFWLLLLLLLHSSLMNL